jgi:dimethylhistidine N-methyltransferase
MLDDTRSDHDGRALVHGVLSGLTRSQKMLPAKLFYDEEGCRLFYQITELPEYYLTRVERSLLANVAPSVLAMFSSCPALVEYGASDETKAAYLFNHDNASAIGAYVPIDVAMPALRKLREHLAARHPTLPVYPIVSDFMKPVVLPHALAGLARLGFFPGSTIGNLDPTDACHFLTLARTTLGEAAKFLVGVDLRKDPTVLLPAYDDAAGVTAAFNRNVLVRLNREAGANFDVNAFTHRALWNDAQSRIEMHLVSRGKQTVQVGGHSIAFLRGETIHTENSYKHTPEGFVAVASRAGWQLRKMWTDDQQLFALFLLQPCPAM